MKLNKKIMTLFLGSLMVFALVGYKSSDSGDKDVYGESGAKGVSSESGDGQLGRGVSLGGGGVSSVGIAGTSGGSGSGSGSGGAEAITEEEEAQLTEISDETSLYNNGEHCTITNGKQNTIAYIGGGFTEEKYDKTAIKADILKDLENTMKFTPEQAAMIGIYNNDRKKLILFPEGDLTTDERKGLIYCDADMLGGSWVVIAYYYLSSIENKVLDYYYVNCCINNNLENPIGEDSHYTSRPITSLMILNHFGSVGDFNDMCDGDNDDWYHCPEVKNQCVDFTDGKSKGRFRNCKPSDTSLYSWELN